MDINSAENNIDFPKNIIIENISKGNFSVDFIILANKILKSKLKLQKNSSESDLRRDLINNYKNIKEIKYHSRKLNYAFMIYVIEVLMGNFTKSKENLFERIVDLNTNTFLESANQLTNFKNIITDIFSIKEVVELFEKKVFKGKFWSNSLLTKKSNFLWVFPNFWTIYGHEQQFKRLCKPWLELFKKAIQKDDTELVFFMMLPLTHIYTNLSTTQEEYRIFNEEVNKSFSDYLIKKVIPKYNIKPNDKKSKKKKIAFVYDRIVGNSPTKLLYSLFEKLVQQDNDKEYFVYDLEIVEKSTSDKKFIDMIKSLGLKYCSAHSLINDFKNGAYYYSHFDKAIALRNRIIQDEIDTLVIGNNWSYQTFLFTTRTAPKQVYWCHGAFEFDVPGIDKRITHIPEGQMQKNFIPFERFNLAQSDVFFDEEVDECKKKAEEIRKKFPENVIILGSIGRLIKLEGEGYLETVAEIMEQCPNTIYLACGSGGVEVIKSKIKELGIEDRFYFVGWVDPKIYAHVIDIYLNTFPDPSGEAQVEFRKRNKYGYLVSLYDNAINYVNDAIFYITNNNIKNNGEFISLRDQNRKKIFNLIKEKVFIVSLDCHNQNSQNNLLKNLIECDNVAIIKPSYPKSELFYNKKSFEIELTAYESIMSADFLVFTQWHERILTKMIELELCRISLIDDKNIFAKNSVKLSHQNLYERVLSQLKDEKLPNNVYDFYLSLFDGYYSDFLNQFYNFDETNLDKLIFEIEHYIENIEDFKIMIKAGKKVTDYYNRLNNLSCEVLDNVNLELGE